VTLQTSVSSQDLTWTIPHQKRSSLGVKTHFTRFKAYESMVYYDDDVSWGEWVNLPPWASPPDDKGPIEGSMHTGGFDASSQSYTVLPDGM